MNALKWDIPFAKPKVPSELTGAGYAPLLSAVLAQRGIETAKEAENFLNDNGEPLPDPFLLKDMDKAVRRIRQAIEKGEKIAVYGDYDVDGITSTCLLTDYFRSCGLDCTPYIPDRNDEGYGLNMSAEEGFAESGITLLITVDCGITAFEEALYAKELGLDLIITDHHECHEGQVPDAVAVVDCKRPDDGYPNSGLAGVGVAFKTVCACSGDEKAMYERYCDLVAMGTVADVMPLTGENRRLVRSGLEKLACDPRPGIRSLLEKSGAAERKLTAATIGFTLAPRINAAGRMGNAIAAARLIMADNAEDADALAEELCEMNRQRQALESDIWNEALERITEKSPDTPIVLESSKWHQGVIGIVASRLAETYGVPAIMIYMTEDRGKGSCRSAGEFNLYEALSECSEYLESFGGHSLAAGLNIKRENIDAFREAIGKYYLENKPEFRCDVTSDILIADPSWLNLEAVSSLELLEPCGSSNPRPVMSMYGAKLESAGNVGNGRHLRVRVSLKGKSFDGIFFGHTMQETGIKEEDLVDLCFSPQINDFRGNRSVQLMISAMRKHESADLCAKIIEGESDCAWAESVFTPSRDDFVQVWKALTRNETDTGTDFDTLLSSCPAGMSEECWCIVLRVLFEAGLIGNSSGVVGAVPLKTEGKTDLNSTDTMKRIAGIG